MNTLSFTGFTRRFALPHWRFYGSGLVLLALVNYISLEIPQYAKEIINAIAAQAESPALAMHRKTAVTIIGLGLAMMIVRSFSRIAIFWPGRKLESEAKSYFFTRTIASTAAFFLKFGMGDLISRLSSDLGQLRAFYAFGLLQILNVFFLLVLTIGRMLEVHTPLTLLALLPLGLMVIIMQVAMPRMHRSSRANQEALGKLTNRVTEAFVNVHVIQANAALASFADRVAKESEHVYQTNMQLVFIRTLVFPLMTSLAGLSQLAVLFYGGHEVMAGRLSVGDILSFNVYIGLLTFPLTAIGIIIALYQSAGTAIERLNDIELAPGERAYRPTELAAAPAPQQELAGSALVVRDLSYTYPGAANAALSGVSLSMRPGMRLGLFGPIGAGKSTLFQLLTRLYDPPAGSIAVDGKDVLLWEPQALRSKIGFAPQSVHLFSASVRENLMFGLLRPPSNGELRMAAEGAQILAEIEALKDGWDTEIGEKGIRLSGGQKQRLALARLFLRQPPVLLLDDVLSAVDHSTETRLLNYIYGLGSTVILASHRGSALRRCDEILILGEGRIKDRGLYADLVRRYPELAAGTA